MIITIDGPAGTGKSTVARLIADKLKMAFFDTGAMYRALTYFALKKKIDIQNLDQIENLLKNFHFSIITNHEKHYIVNGEDVTAFIRLPEVNQWVSNIAALKAVRSSLVKIQREFAKESGGVFEGRDMGTVVFPDADAKFFLIATAEIRAQRRYHEYAQKHSELTINKEQVIAEMAKRDHLDTSREISPLKQADDALVIDTSHLSIAEVVEKIISLLPSRG